MARRSAPCPLADPQSGDTSLCLLGAALARSPSGIDPREGSPAPAADKGLSNRGTRRSRATGGRDDCPTVPPTIRGGGRRCIRPVGGQNRRKGGAMGVGERSDPTVLPGSVVLPDLSRHDNPLPHLAFPTIRRGDRPGRPRSRPCQRRIAPGRPTGNRPARFEPVLELGKIGTPRPSVTGSRTRFAPWGARSTLDNVLICLNPVLAIALAISATGQISRPSPSVPGGAAGALPRFAQAVTSAARPRSARPSPAVAG